MDSLNQTSNFCYNSSTEVETDMGSSSILEIFVHHARNIHNICIYDNQDVYAKFSLTYNPDEAISTRVIIGGGKNPEFNQKLELKVSQTDAVLKCEIWMLSRVRNLLEDQLLGFALVPISLVINQGGKISSQDFSLSSTDLFHSPAGIVQLSVSISSTKTSSKNPFPNFSTNSSISSEVVLLDPYEYSRVEFPDINAAAQDQIMVYEYFNSNPKSRSHNNFTTSFLHLLQTRDDNNNDHDMIGNSSMEALSSNTTTTTSSSLSDDRTTVDLKSADTKRQSSSSLARGEDVIASNEVDGNMGRAYPGRVQSMDMDREQAAMQQQIVDMYMKSMQQFTESLAKMKLPTGFDPKPDEENSGNVNRILDNNKLEMEKKDGSRVFYGSRAFF